MKSTKFQAPISKEIPMTNHPIPIAACPISEASPWSLKFGASVLLGCWCLVLLAVVPAHAQYSIDWFTVDGGGGASSGGSFTLTGTIGQPDTGTLSGGNYSLQGGFWPAIVLPSTGEAPTLLIQLSSASIVILWSPATPGFSMEQSSTLLPGSWAPAPNGADNPATIPLGSAPTFYRLKKP